MVNNPKNNQNQSSAASWEEQACPMTASVGWQPDADSEEMLVAWFEEFDKLPLSIRLGLGHAKVVEAVSLLAKSYGILDAAKVGEISRIIREVFTRGIREVEIKQRVKEKIGFNESVAENFSSDIRKIVAFVKQVGQEAAQQDLEQWDVLTALKKYPSLGDQEITSQFLRLKTQPENVAPSIKHWLEDYFSRLGTGKHSSMQRSDYLFKSENGKNLLETERNRVGVILKSYDTNDSIAIDRTTKQIVFSEGLSENLEKRGIATPIQQVEKQEEERMKKAAEFFQTPAKPAAAQLDNKNSQPTNQLNRNNLWPNQKLNQAKVNFPAPKAQSVIAPRPAVKENSNNSPLVSRPAGVKLEEKTTPARQMAKNVVDLSDFM